MSTVLSGKYRTVLYKVVLESGALPYIKRKWVPQYVAARTRFQLDDGPCRIRLRGRRNIRFWKRRNQLSYCNCWKFQELCNQVRWRSFDPHWSFSVSIVAGAVDSLAVAGFRCALPDVPVHPLSIPRRPKGVLRRNRENSAEAEFQYVRGCYCRLDLASSFDLSRMNGFFV